jgi:hypothetical protein
MGRRRHSGLQYPACPREVVGDLRQKRDDAKLKGWGADVFGRGQAESPGSDGASPYQPSSSTTAGLLIQQYFVSDSAGFDAAKNSAKHFLIVGNAWLRLAPV